MNHRILSTVFLASSFVLVLPACDSEEAPVERTEEPATVDTEAPAEIDSEAPGTDAAPAGSHQVVAHIDLSDVRAAPWIADKLQLDAPVPPEFAACKDLFMAAESITIRGEEGAFEAYVKGPMDPDVAEGCAETLRKEMHPRHARAHEAVQIGEDLFAITAGDAEANTTRLAALLRSAPAGIESHSIWVRATPGDDHGVQAVEGWVDIGKDLDAHFSVTFDDESKASKHYAEASMALAAMGMADEYADLASAVKVSVDGPRLVADVHATQEQMNKLTAMHPEHGDHAGMKIRVEHAADGEMPEDLPEHGMRFQIGGDVHVAD